MLSEQLQVHVIVVRGKHYASLQSNVKGCSSNLSESANCTKHARAYIWHLSRANAHTCVCICIKRN